MPEGAFVRKCVRAIQCKGTGYCSSSPFTASQYVPASACCLQELESKEKVAQRKARTAAALERYRKNLGLDMDPATEATARALFDSGSELMRKGRLEVCVRVCHALISADIVCY